MWIGKSPSFPTRSPASVSLPPRTPPRLTWPDLRKVCRRQSAGDIGGRAESYHPLAALIQHRLSRLLLRIAASCFVIAEPRASVVVLPQGNDARQGHLACGFIVAARQKQDMKLQRKITVAVTFRPMNESHEDPSARKCVPPYAHRRNKQKTAACVSLPTGASSSASAYHVVPRPSNTTPAGVRFSAATLPVPRKRRKKKSDP